jgi:hypothetical protein
VLKKKAVLVVSMLVGIQACGKTEEVSEVVVKQEAQVESAVATVIPEMKIDADSFVCLSKMTAVRHYFVDNLRDDLAATVAAAKSTDGAVFPPGSVVQLVPTEAMVKHESGWNAATNDWEFFELDVSAEGSSIRNRGFTDVVNRFGGNCFGCHIKAEAKYDFICELDHGCDPIPVTREMIAGIQAQDPRCAD